MPDLFNGSKSNNQEDLSKGEHDRLQSGFDNGKVVRFRREANQDRKKRYWQYQVDAGWEAHAHAQVQVEAHALWRTNHDDVVYEDDAMEI